MNLRTKLTVLTLCLLVSLTIALGLIGWVASPPDPQGLADLIAQKLAGTAGPPSFTEALYRSVIAFGGDGIYQDPKNLSLNIARFLGVLATLAAVGVVIYLYFRERLIEHRARKLCGHLVLVGTSPFALSYAMARLAMTRSRLARLPFLKRLWRYMVSDEGRLTIIETVATTSGLAHIARTPGVRVVTCDPSDVSAVLPYLGVSPEKVILGGSDEIANINASRALVGARPGLPMMIGIEHESLAKDLALLSPQLEPAEILSSARFVAGALVTHLAPTELANIRRHKRVHVALIGFGSMGLALAEEFALRCHVPGLGKTKITIFDKDAAAAALRLRRERPGLREAAIIAGPHQLDAVCAGLTGSAPNHPACRDIVEVEADDTDPFTVIIVCTGDDTENVAIGTRLRQLQRDNQVLRAPVLIRMQSSRRVEPEPVDHLTKGIAVFGGNACGGNELALERLREELAANLHAEWGRNLEPARRHEIRPWSELSASGKRTNLRAALSAIEVLRGQGFVEPAYGDLADLAVDRLAVDSVLSDISEMEKLAIAEHDRWIAERQCEGWSSGPDGQKIAARKWHLGFVPFDQLSPELQKHDRVNVASILNRVRIPEGPAVPARRWRKRLRIGVMGGIELPASAEDKMRAEIDRMIDTELPLPLNSLHLEVVTNDAPGFDRIAAALLLERWHAKTRRKADLLSLRISDTDFLDIKAMGRDLRDANAQNAVKAAMRSQTLRLKHAQHGRYRQTEILAPGVFNDQFIADGFFIEDRSAGPNDDPAKEQAFAELIETAGAQLSDLSDLLFAHVASNSGDFTRRVSERRAEQGKHTVFLTML